MYIYIYIYVIYTHILFFFLRTRAHQRAKVRVPWWLTSLPASGRKDGSILDTRRASSIPRGAALGRRTARSRRIRRLDDACRLTHTHSDASLGNLAGSRSTTDFEPIRWM